MAVVVVVIVVIVAPLATVVVIGEVASIVLVVAVDTRVESDRLAVDKGIRLAKTIDNKSLRTKSNRSNVNKEAFFTLFFSRIFLSLSLSLSSCQFI